MREPYFSWDEETGQAICLIQDGNKFYYGTASCMPEDEDMKSEKVGCEIAWRRASISAAQKQKEKVVNQLEALKHYKSTLNQNKLYPNKDEFFADSTKYMYNRLNKEIKNLENKYHYLQTRIDLEKTRLKEYIKDKDDFYKYIRNKRQGKTEQS